MRILKNILIIRDDSYLLSSLNVWTFSKEVLYNGTIS
jgi:hypothetical protein